MASPAPDIEKISGLPNVTPVSPDNDGKQHVKPEDADMALQVYNITGYTQEELANVNEKKLLRKIDLHLLPIMFIAITLFTLDKSTLGYSAIMGISEDAHLTSDQYSWLGSIFSLGYLFANIPCALIIQKVSLSKWIVMTMSIWGVLLAVMAACFSFGPLFALRILLGFFEASITPVFVIMTGMWYKRNEQAKRLGIWYSGVGLAGIIGAPMAWSMSATDAKMGILKSWQFLFVITGALTVALALIFYFVVPDSQLSAKFLTPAEKVVAIERLRTNQQGIGNKKFKLYQVVELLRDPRTYLYFTMQFVSNIAFNSASTFGSLLIKSLGYTTREALILQVPSGVINLFSVIIACYMADYMRDRTLWSGISSIIAAVCGGIMYALADSNKVGSLVAFYFQHVFTATYILNFSMVADNTAGHTKKVLTNAVLLIGSTTGSLTGPQITKNDESYKKVMLVMTIGPAGVFVIVCILRMINIMENKRRNKLEATDDDYVVDREFLDLTDGENTKFRYAM